MESKSLKPPYLPSLKRTVTPDDYFRFIPTYMGSVVPGKELSFATNCFGKNVATLTYNNNHSVQLNFATTEKSSFFCDDTYLFGYAFYISVDGSFFFFCCYSLMNFFSLRSYVSSFEITFFEVPWWTHTAIFYGPWTEAELFDLNTNGIRVFKFPDGLTAVCFLCVFVSFVYLFTFFFLHGFLKEIGSMTDG
jgi:hypothetical protein